MELLSGAFLILHHSFVAGCVRNGIRVSESPFLPLPHLSCAMTFYFLITGNTAEAFVLS